MGRYQPSNNDFIVTDVRTESLIVDCIELTLLGNTQSWLLF